MKKLLVTDEGSNHLAPKPVLHLKLDLMIKQQEKNLAADNQAIKAQQQLLQKLFRAVVYKSNDKAGMISQRITLLQAPLHMSLVNWAGLVSEISPHHSFLCKNFDESI